MTDNCIGPLIEATGGRVSKKELMAVIEDLIGKKESKSSQQKSNGAKWREAADELAEAALEAAAVRKRNEVMNTMKRQQRRAFYDGAPTPRLAMEAKLVGVNTPFAGNRLSVAAQHTALTRELGGGFFLDLEREGLERIFASRAIEDQWTDELFELNRGEAGKPGITGNADALRIAQTIAKWQKAAIAGLNAEGAWIKTYSGYVTKTTHDPDAVRRAGRDEWVRVALENIDIGRMFGGDLVKAKNTLRAMWVPLKNGDHLRLNEDAVDDLTFEVGMNVAAKVSAHREIHFKSARHWRAYNERFGMGGPTETVMRGLDTAARHIALMREFGTNPRAAFESDMLYLRDKFADTEHYAELDKWERALTVRFSLLDGEANRPVNRMSADITSGWMALQRIAKLGLTPFAMLADLATKASELRYQGLSLPERWGTSFSGYFRGAEDSEKRQVAELLLAGLDSRIGRISAHFDAFDTPRGQLARWENFFFRATGISAMTDNQRADAEVIMARHMGTLKGTPWKKIGESERRILTSFGIREAEWALLNKVDWRAVDGRTYMTPDIAEKISDEDMEAYLRFDRRLKPGSSEDTVRRAIKNGRDDLATRIHAYFADRGEYAILDVGPRERAMLLQGAQPGTPLGVALRLLMQFKAFPAAMLAKTWGREIYGGQGRMGALAGLTELIIASTALGIVANALNQIVKGQDPFAQWENNPGQSFLAGFLRGGGGTIYGDFLFGEWSRFGRTVTSTLVGPTFSQMDTLAEIYTKTLRGEDAAATSVRLVRDNLPFMNMIWTKAAFDYLILFQIQEALNPGYLRRMERTQKQNRGTEYWLPPSAVVN